MTSSNFRATRPVEGEFLPYYGQYIDKVPAGDVVETLRSQVPGTLALIRSLSEADGDKRYAPEKWSVKEVVGHVIDAERIFVYRALRFARSDSQPVPGFDENTFAKNSPYSHVSLADIASELESVRAATVHFFSNLEEPAFSRRGSANGAEITVRALAFILAGHEVHHVGVLRNKYLNA